MSKVAENAVVRLLLSDYAAGDAANKLNVLGGGLQVIARDHSTGVTNSFALTAMISFSPDSVGENPAIELILEDDTGTPVALPGPAGPLAAPQNVIIAQSHHIEEPLFPGVGVPRNQMRPTMQMVLNFPNGLPLAGGRFYSWRIAIDHDRNDKWSEAFYVPAPPAGIVVGGHHGPADIPR